MQETSMNTYTIKKHGKSNLKNKKEAYLWRSSQQKKLPFSRKHFTEIKFFKGNQRKVNTKKDK